MTRYRDVAEHREAWEEAARRLSRVVWHPAIPPEQRKIVAWKAFRCKLKAVWIWIEK